MFTSNSLNSLKTLLSKNQDTLTPEELSIAIDFVKKNIYKPEVLTQIVELRHFHWVCIKGSNTLRDSIKKELIKTDSLWKKLHLPSLINKLFDTFCKRCADPKKGYDYLGELLFNYIESGMSIDDNCLHPDLLDLPLSRAHKVLLSGFSHARLPNDPDEMFEPPPPYPRGKNFYETDIWEKNEAARYRMPESLRSENQLALFEAMLLQPMLRSVEWMYRAGMTSAFICNDGLYSKLIVKVTNRLAGEGSIAPTLPNQLSSKQKLHVCQCLVTLQAEDFQPFVNAVLTSDQKIISALLHKHPELVSYFPVIRGVYAMSPRILQANRRALYPCDKKTHALLSEWYDLNEGNLPPLRKIWDTIYADLDPEVFRPWFTAICFSGPISREQRTSLFFYLRDHGYPEHLLALHFDSLMRGLLRDICEKVAGRTDPFSYSSEKRVPLTRLIPLMERLLNQIEPKNNSNPLEILAKKLWGPGKSEEEVEWILNHNPREILAEILWKFAETDIERHSILSAFRFFSFNPIQDFKDGDRKTSPSPVQYFALDVKDLGYKRPDDDLQVKYRRWEMLQTKWKLLDLDKIWERDHKDFWGPKAPPAWYCLLRHRLLPKEAQKDLQSYLVFGEKQWNKKLDSYSTVRNLFEEPSEFAATITKAVHTIQLSVEQHGSHFHTAVQVVKTLLPSSELKHSDEISEFGRNLRTCLLQSSHPSSIEQLESLEEHFEDYIRFGRSFKRKKEQRYEVCKIATQQCYYIAEFAVLRQLKESRSQLPKPLGYYKVRTLSDPVYESLKKGGYTLFGNNNHVYRYECDSNYLRYLNGADVSDEEFRSGHRAFIYDTCAIIGETQLIPVVADLFHNQEQKRRYLVLHDLLLFQEDDFGSNRYGLGRIDDILKAVAYPNARVSGWADFGDLTPLENIQKDPGSWANDLKYQKVTWEPLANGIAEMILTDMLLQVTRLRAQGRLNYRDEDIVKLTADFTQEACALALEGYTKRSAEQCSLFTQQCGINWTDLARECLYWAQDDEKGYIGDLKRGQVPDCIKPTDVEFFCEGATASQNFHFQKGFSKDGEAPDLGAYNASSGWSRLELALYIISSVALCVREADYRDSL